MWNTFDLLMICGSCDRWEGSYLVSCDHKYQVFRIFRNRGDLASYTMNCFQCVFIVLMMAGG